MKSDKDYIGTRGGMLICYKKYRCPATSAFLHYMLTYYL